MDITLDRKVYISFPDLGAETIDWHIESGTMVLEEMICSGNLNFGEVVCNKFEVAIFNIGDIAGQKVEVIAIDDGDEEHPHRLFQGYVDSCEQDYFGYDRQIVAYDLMYKFGQINVAVWWNDFWSTRSTATIAELRGSLLAWINTVVTLPYDSEAEYFLDDMEIPVKTLSFDTLLFRDILAFICQIQCLFPNITRDGELELIDLYGSEALELDNDMTEKTQCVYEEYDTAPVTRVAVVMDGAIVTETDAEAAINQSSYVIEDNLLLQECTPEQVGDFASAYKEHVSEVSSYNPAKIKMIVTDDSYRVGDVLETSKGFTPIFKMTLSGIMLADQTMEAMGDEYLTETPIAAALKFSIMQQKSHEDVRRWRALEDDITGFRSEVGENLINIQGTAESALSAAQDAQEAAQSAGAGLANLEQAVTRNTSAIEQNAQAIEAKVSTETFNALTGQVEEMAAAMELMADKVQIYLSEDGKIARWFNFSQDGLEIGLADSNVKNLLTNDSIKFVDRSGGEQGGAIFASFDKDQAEMTTVNSVAQLKISAGKVGASIDQWAIRKGMKNSDGNLNLSIIWIGG